MLPKIVETDPYLVSRGGSAEKTVVLLDESEGFGSIKIASEATEFAKTLRPTPGKTKILVLAMGASEYYGPNRNGDAFRESELIEHHGTFKTNSHVFRSHVNKDPAKSIGRVLESFYNKDMHRVELILELDDEKAAPEVEKIRANKDVAVSMGCRIKYDVCSICGNKAPTRAEYCKHLKYEMGEIRPDGRIVCADNPRPNFFDISIVFRPADKTGYMLKKIAKDNGGVYVEDKSADLAIKSATLTVLSSYLRKAADIDKTVTGIAVGIDSDSISTTTLNEKTKKLTAKWLSTLTPKLVADYTSLDKSKLNSLSRESFSKTLTMLADSGVFLMTPEFMELLFNKLLGKSVPSGLSEKLVSLQKEIFSLLAANPEIPAKSIEDKAIPTLDSTSMALDKEARLSLSSENLGNTREADLDANTCKVAGYGAVLYASYVSSMLEACESRSEKLASLVDVEYQAISRSGSPTSQLAYLEHRSMDLLKNHGTFCKLSSDHRVSDLDLFSNSPDEYYLLLGQNIITAN